MPRQGPTSSPSNPRKPARNNSPPHHFRTIFSARLGKKAGAGEFQSRPPRSRLPRQPEWTWSISGCWLMKRQSGALWRGQSFFQSRCSLEIAPQSARMIIPFGPARSTLQVRCGGQCRNSGGLVVSGGRGRCCWWPAVGHLQGQGRITNAANIAALKGGRLMATLGCGSPARSVSPRRMALGLSGVGGNPPALGSWRSGDEPHALAGDFALPPATDSRSLARTWRLANCDRRRPVNVPAKG